MSSVEPERMLLHCRAEDTKLGRYVALSCSRRMLADQIGKRRRTGILPPRQRDRELHRR